MPEIEQDTTAAGKETPAPAAVDAAAASTAAAGKTDTPAVPESYTFAFPEQTLLDKDAAAKRLTERLKGLKVTDAAIAQSYLDVAHEEVTSTMEQWVASHRPDGSAFKAMVDGYRAEALTAPDLGNGDPLQLERKMLNAQLVLNRYAATAPKAVARLTETGMLYDPEMLRLFNAVHEATKEPGSPSGNPATLTEPAGYSALFPNGVPKDNGLSTTAL